MTLAPIKKRVLLAIFIKPLSFISLLVLFFLLYNTFLVDRNLEMLKLSLSSVALAQTTSTVSYIGPIMQYQSIGELSSQVLAVKEFIDLEYTSNILQTSTTDRAVADVRVVLETVVKERQEKRPIILRWADRLMPIIKAPYRAFKRAKEQRPSGNIEPELLDQITKYESAGDYKEAIKAYKDMINRFPRKAETPSLILRLGYLLHKQGEISEAQNYYENVTKDFPNLPEATIAKELKSALANMPALITEADSVLNKALTTKDQTMKQMLYYKAGLLQLKAYDFRNAIKSFKKTIETPADNRISDQAYSRMATCQSMLGAIEESKNLLQQIDESSASDSLKMQAKFQLAAIYRQQGDFEKTCSLMEQFIEENEDSSLVPHVMFQQGSIYLFDLKHLSKAKEIFKKLRMEFPASPFSYPGTSFVSKYIDIDVLHRVSESEKSIFATPWFSRFLPKKVKEIVSDSAVRFTKRVTDGVKDIVIQEEMVKGDYGTIDLTEKRLNKYVKDWFLKDKGTTAKDVSVEFLGESRLRATGKVPLNTIIGFGSTAPVEISIEGVFKKVSLRPPQWEDDAKRKNYITYSVESARIANIPILPAMFDIAVTPSEIHFNKDFPLEFEEFELNKQKILFRGPVREDILDELDAEARGLRHMEIKDAESGFVKGQRGTQRYDRGTRHRAGD